MISFNHTVILWTSVKISGGTKVKNPPADAGDIRGTGLIPGLGRSPGEGNGNPLQYSGEPHGQWSLVGYSPWGRKESDMTEHIHMQANKELW